MTKKRRGGLSGISHFVLNAFTHDSAPIDSTLVSQENIPELESRPAKRQKKSASSTDPTAEGEIWVNKQWIKRYDARGLVPHYTHISQVPDHLQKYFSQRHRYFTLYSTPPGCLLDEEGWYSVTPELVAHQIAERCRCDTILDAFCGVGGNAIAFAQTCQRVIALDTSPTRLALARHNAQVYGVADRIEFMLSDYISFANSYLSLQHSQKSPRRIDVVFLSPPWGGPSYLSGSANQDPALAQKSTSIHQSLEPKDVSFEEHPSYSLSSIQPIHGAELFKLSRRITPNIAYYLPRNTCLQDISGLLETEGVSGGEGVQSGKTEADVETDVEHVEVEEEWMGSKLKALTCYFGGLAAGQEAMY